MKITREAHDKLLEFLEEYGDGGFVRVSRLVTGGGCCAKPSLGVSLDDEQRAPGSRSKCTGCDMHRTIAARSEADVFNCQAPIPIEFAENERFLNRNPDDPLRR